MNIRAIKAGDLIEYIREHWGEDGHIGIRASKDLNAYDANFEIDAEFVLECFNSYDEDDQYEMTT